MAKSFSEFARVDPDDAIGYGDPQAFRLAGGLPPRLSDSEVGRFLKGKLREAELRIRDWKMSLLADHVEILPTDDTSE